MTEEILALAPMLSVAMPQLEAAYKVHRVYEMNDAAQISALLSERGPNVRAIATDGAYGVTSDVMVACTNLQMIANFGVGYDGVPMDECRSRGIRVTNTPDVLNDAVAEMALALMLSLARKTPQIDRYVRDGRWVSDGHYPLTPELTGRTVGILGLGRIGKEIAARCEAFKMTVAYHGRSKQPDQRYRYYADLEDMARDVDWLVLIAPGTLETTGIVSRSVMAALGPDGCLVNIARGALVDQPALVEMLTTGGLGAAALDVYLDEPNVPKELFNLDNVVLTPHVGSATSRTRGLMGDLVVNNLKAFFAGEALLTPVN